MVVFLFCNFTVFVFLGLFFPRREHLKHRYVICTHSFIQMQTHFSVKLSNFRSGNDFSNQKALPIVRLAMPFNYYGKAHFCIICFISCMYFGISKLCGQWRMQAPQPMQLVGRLSSGRAKTLVSLQAPPIFASL